MPSGNAVADAVTAAVGANGATAGATDSIARGTALGSGARTSEGSDATAGRSASTSEDARGLSLWLVANHAPTAPTTAKMAANDSSLVVVSLLRGTTVAAE
jgi:hypothetical protein